MAELPEIMVPFGTLQNHPHRLWGSPSFLSDGCPETLSPGVKRMRPKANRLLLSTVEVKNECSCTSTPLCVSMAWTGTPSLHSYQPVKGLLPRPGIFNALSRIPELELRISLVSAWPQRSLVYCKKKKRCKLCFLIKTGCLQEHSNTEPLNQNANEQQITEK